MPSTSSFCRARSIRLDVAQIHLEQADRPDGERDRPDAPSLVEVGELGRAAADVDEERALVREPEPANDRELDEPRFLDALDDLELDARLAPRALDERGAVRRLADRARRRGSIDVDLGPVHRLAELAERGAGQPDSRTTRACPSRRPRCPRRTGARRLTISRQGAAGVREEGELLPVETRSVSLDDAQPQGVRAEVERSKARHGDLLPRCLVEPPHGEASSRQPLSSLVVDPRPLRQGALRLRCARSGTFSSRARRLVEGSRFAGSIDRTTGGVLLLIGWIGGVVALHRLGRTGSDRGSEPGSEGRQTGAVTSR